MQNSGGKCMRLLQAISHLCHLLHPTFASQTNISEDTNFLSFDLAGKKGGKGVWGGEEE